MKLKYNLIAWSLLGFFAAACDPMDDIYNEIMRKVQRTPRRWRNMY